MKKKIITFIIIFLYFFLLLSHSINAEFMKSKFDNHIISNYFKKMEQLGSVYDLVVISPKKFVKALQPLEFHKNKVGVKTRIVSLEEVYDKMFWQGRDNAEKIKYFIKEAAEKWGIKYVLLVGDFRLIPVRYCYNQDDSQWYYEPRFISELYYADIYDKNGNFSTWDLDNDGVFGEWKLHSEEAEDKYIDLNPDVYVGRLACRNVFEVKTVVRKIIRYETKTYGKEWFKRIAVVAGDSFPADYFNPNWTEYEGELNTLQILENMSDFEHIKLWTSNGNLTGPKDVISTINNGCGFIYLEGHSVPVRWMTHPPNDMKWVLGLSTFTMNFLSNKDMLPVCVVFGCHISQFDVNIKKLLENHITQLTWVPECFSWKLTKKVGGGSIATIGCTGFGMAKEDKDSFEEAGECLNKQFFYEYGLKKTDILGELWGKTISNYLNKYPIDWNTQGAGDYAIDAKTVQQWVILGDPSLKIGGYCEY